MSEERRKFVEQFMYKLSNQKIEDFGYDGSYLKGFIMKNIEDSLDSEENGIKNPFWGIVSFRPFTCFYAK